MTPIELRIDKHPKHYSVTKVWPGIGNVSFVNQKFTTKKDAIDWCKREWPNVPRISG